MARELARHGHRLPMIEALLVANGFQEVDVFLNQPHIHNELVDLANRVRRGEQAVKGKLSRSLNAEAGVMTGFPPDLQSEP
jgi:hypothetical protein